MSHISYRLAVKDANAHLLEVTCTVAEPSPDGQEFGLPVWIPGSYLVREFARNIIAFRAHTADGAPVPVEKIAKATWRCAPTAGPLTVTYEVYAYDWSVRAAHVDTSRLYFNGTSVFVYPEWHVDEPCEVEIVRPADAWAADWEVYTALPRAGAAEFGFGRYRAGNYDELIDHPVECGKHTRVRFEAAGVPHDLVLVGRVTNAESADLERVAADFKKVCEWQINLFNRPAPMDYYLFHTVVLDEGYGGLEHRASTSLVSNRNALPACGDTTLKEEYKKFLGLVSHEYFHTWNVKRLKPAVFWPYDLKRENYTQLLWWFEGITSYYDDLALARCGLFKADDYLELLARSITTVQRGAGRLKQSVADASFDAWIKYYRQDENAPNALVSYYVKGSLIGLALDLILRRDGQKEGGRSLDDLLRALWVRYYENGEGVPEGAIETLAKEISGLDLSDFFARYVYGVEDLPLAELLADFGVRLHLRASDGNSDSGGKAGKCKEAAPKPWLGVKVAGDGRITHVLDGGSAQAAGLAVGDVLVAIDGIRATSSNWETLVGGRSVGKAVPFHVFRRDELVHVPVTLVAAPLDTVWLELDTEASGATADRRAGWLGVALQA